MMKTKILKVAILNMYKENTDNQGLRCIQEILDRSEINISYTYFDVRSQFEIPNLDFDVYISTGGPGNPLEYDENWSDKYAQLIDDLFEWNKENKHYPKFLFAICHSFQMLCAQTGIAKITKREHVSFGIVPLIKTSSGSLDEILLEFDDKFFVADHRYFQVVNPDISRLEQLDASILAFDELFPDLSIERSLMAVRFSPEIIGVQFHPEADVKGMKAIISRESVQAEIAKVFGSKKLGEINSLLDDPDTIEKMHQTMLPKFLLSCQNRLSYSLNLEAVNESV